MDGVDGVDGVGSRRGRGSWIFFFFLIYFILFFFVEYQIYAVRSCAPLTAVFGTFKDTENREIVLSNVIWKAENETNKNERTND